MLYLSPDEKVMNGGGQGLDFPCLSLVGGREVSDICPEYSEIREIC